MITTAWRRWRCCLRSVQAVIKHIISDRQIRRWFGVDWSMLYWIASMEQKKKFLGSVKTASYSQVPTTSIAWIMCRMLAKAWLANHAYRSARCDWILYAACRHLIWLGLFLFEGNCITPSIDICKTNTSYHALHRWPHVLMLHDRTTDVYLISPSNLLHREDHCLVVHYPRIPPFMIKSIVK